MSGKQDEPEIECEAQIHGTSSHASVTADDVWDIMPHCSVKQALLITCIVYTLMHRGVLV